MCVIWVKLWQAGVNYWPPWFLTAHEVYECASFVLFCNVIPLNSVPVIDPLYLWVPHSWSQSISERTRNIWGGGVSLFWTCHNKHVGGVHGQIHSEHGHNDCIHSEHYTENIYTVPFFLSILLKQDSATDTYSVLAFLMTDKIPDRGNLKEKWWISVCDFRVQYGRKREAEVALSQQ